MSKEHFWPDWLSLYIEKKSSDKHIGEVHSGEGKGPKTVQSKKERPGNLITKKFRVVCKNCNNGWMSGLEEQVKPFWVEMLKNNTVSLSFNELLSLSRWIVMKVIVAEQSEDGTQVTPEHDRVAFFEKKTIPEYFRVYIARHNSKSASAYLRHSTTLSLSPTGPTPALKGMKRNVQTVSFLVGPLFVFVIAARLDDFNLASGINLHSMSCIWPHKPEEFKWPSGKIVTENEMSNIAHALEDFTSSSRVKYGGPLQDNF